MAATATGAPKPVPLNPAPQQDQVDPYAATGVPVTPPPTTIGIAPPPPAPVPISTPPVSSTAPASGGTVIGSVAPPIAPEGPSQAPSAPVPSPSSPANTATAMASTPPAVTGSLPTGVSTTGFGPGNTLIGQQITTANDPSRIDLAKQYFDQMSQATDPAYAASLRKATQVAAANGGLGSGQLNTSYGDLALQRAQNLDLLQRGLLTDATQGTISDNLNNANQARTERGYQNDLQTQALQQRLQQLMLEQQIGGNQAGYLGSYNANPNLAASTSYGNTASQQSTALQQMLAALYGQIPTTGTTTSSLPPAGGIDQILGGSDYINKLLGG